MGLGRPAFTAFVSSAPPTTAVGHQPSLESEQASSVMRGCSTAFAGEAFGTDPTIFDSTLTRSAIEIQFWMLLNSWISICLLRSEISAGQVAVGQDRRRHVDLKNLPLIPFAIDLIEGRQS
jgi:hypothetical protein